MVGSVERKPDTSSNRQILSEPIAFDLGSQKSAEPDRWVEFNRHRMLGRACEKVSWLWMLHQQLAVELLDESHQHFLESFHHDK